MTDRRRDRIVRSVAIVLLVVVLAALAVCVANAGPGLSSTSVIPITGGHP